MDGDEIFAAMRAAAFHLVVALAVAQPCSAMAEDRDVAVDWVQAYEDAQNENSYDYLLSCWANQWPRPAGVKAAEGPEAATKKDIEVAARATVEHCELEMRARVDQIHIDLARKGMEPSEIVGLAERQIRAEIEDMFQEYWGRL